MPPSSVHVVIEGHPLPSKRPRFTLVPLWRQDELLRRAAGARSIADVAKLFRPQVYQPAKGPHRTFQTAIELTMKSVRNRQFPGEVMAAKGDAVEVFILCVMPLPKADHRKTREVPRSWCVSRGRGDWDNLGKPVCDAANGVLWADDSQIVSCVVEKVVGAQGESARIEVYARRVERSARDTIFETVTSGSAVEPLRAVENAKGSQACPKETSAPTLPLDLDLGPATPWKLPF